MNGLTPHPFLRWYEDRLGFSINGGRRRKDIVRARWCAAWIIRSWGFSLPAIGIALHLDHSSVLNGVRHVEARADLRALAMQYRDAYTQREVSQIPNLDYGVRG